MESKIFELRADYTLLVLLAIKLLASNEQERYLLSHSGFGLTYKQQNNYILVMPLDGGTGYATSDPYEHKINDIRIVHQYIYKHFDELIPGQVIDVDYINGYSTTPKLSDSRYFQDLGDGWD